MTKCKCKHCCTDVLSTLYRAYLYAVVVFFRWWCLRRSTWTVTCSLCPITCSYTITLNTDAELVGWTLLKALRHTWNTVSVRMCLSIVWRQWGNGKFRWSRLPHMCFVEKVEKISVLICAQIFHSLQPEISVFLISLPRLNDLGFAIHFDFIAVYCVNNCLVFLSPEEKLILMRTISENSLSQWKHWTAEQ